MQGVNDNEVCLQTFIFIFFNLKLFTVTPLTTTKDKKLTQVNNNRTDSDQVA